MISLPKNTVFIALILSTFSLLLNAIPTDFYKRELDPTFQQFQDYTPTKRGPQTCTTSGRSCDGNNPCDTGCYCYHGKCEKNWSMRQPVKNVKKGSPLSKRELDPTFQRFLDYTPIKRGTQTCTTSGRTCYENKPCDPGCFCFHGFCEKNSIIRQQGKNVKKGSAAI